MIKFFDGSWEATSADIQAQPNFDIVYECFCEGVADELVYLLKHDREAA